MDIFSNFLKNIGESGRWNGRTQSSVSWSPEQLRQDLRTQVETVGIEDRGDDLLPTCQEIPTIAESGVGVMEHSGGQSG